MIELVHLEKKYENATPLADVNAVIHDGDVISVIGPSGTGKSTLLRCINLLEKPTGGQILLDGTDITAPGYDVTLARRRMGMVFQSFNLFGHLTVIENLMLAPMDILKKSKQEAYDTGVALLKRVGGRLKSLIVCPAFWICSVQIRGMIGLGTRADLRSCWEWYREGKACISKAFGS